VQELQVRETVPEMSPRGGARSAIMADMPTASKIVRSENVGMAASDVGDLLAGGELLSRAYGSTSPGGTSENECMRFGMC
jgi:hypothetical protein